jgi:NADH dehydrogenase (ubiquinone) 1 alpha subcomplex subunit 4
MPLLFPNDAIYSGTIKSEWYDFFLIKLSGEIPFIYKNKVISLSFFLYQTIMSALVQFLKKSQKPEVYPIIGILSVALVGAGYVGVHAAKAPDVAWDHKSNPYPWQDIKEGEQVKLLALNQKYERRWDRTKL